MLHSVLLRSLWIGAVLVLLACPGQPKAASKGLPEGKGEAPPQGRATEAPAPAGERRGAAERLGPPTRRASELVPGEGQLYAILRTSKGTMVARLFEEAAPVTVANFVGLATGQHPYLDPQTLQITRGRYFDGLLFHRVIPGFMVQTGDPTGTGRGGPGYRFQNENPDQPYDRPGLLGMANSGPNTNGSQFFITEAPAPHLNGGYTVFGELVSGLEVVAAIARVPRGPGNRPVEPVRLESVEIVRSKTPPSPGTTNAAERGAPSGSETGGEKRPRPEAAKTR